MDVAATIFSKPDKSILFSLLIGIHLSALPIYIGMPIPILLLALTLTAWQIYIVSQNKNNPGKFVQIIIIFVTCVIILYSYRHLLGQLPGIALITLMTLLKLFEIKKLRDCYIVIYSSLFIIASNFFHSQTVWLILYVFFVVIFLVSTLIALSDKLNTVPLKSRIRMSTQFIVYALPLMLILFVLFPRIPGPLWGLPDNTFASQTGLSEEMSPGSINSLINSSAIAFRVKFDDEIPSHNQRYWRGAVLSSYDGITWRRDDAGKKALDNIEYKKSSPSFRYSITLEPTNLNWLLSLEYPQTYNQQYRLSREAMLLAKSKINNVIQYTITSKTTATNAALFPQESYKNRLIPANLNFKAQRFAEQLLLQSNFDETRYINKVLAYFRDNEFVYTLQPDLLGTDAMDDFLFQTRRGFCEHYASAFTYLMRAAGIPSRVVIGYQGGKMNPLDDYMIVRQSDAHAWSEVWINNHWLRVDPTTAVSPDRIEQGIQNAGLDNNQLPLLLVSNSTMLKNAAFLYDSFQNKWNQWVIGFDQKKQNDLLKYLGFENNNASNLILLLVIFMSIAGLIVAWFLFKQVTTNNDRVQHYYNIFCRKLQTSGVTCQLNEGPSDFEARIYKELILSQKTKNEIGFILKAYRSLHFGNSDNENIRKHYIQRIKKLRIRK